MIGGDDNEDDPLTREILGLIRPEQNGANDGGTAQAAEGLFSNLRRQLDSLQSQVDGQGTAFEGELHSGNSNMGWR